MNLKSMLGKAKKQADAVIEKRGGQEALKQDLNELKDIAKSKGTTKDKAKAAAEALKQPGGAKPR
ncbi:hypothetical protein GKE82_15510 [Conexibacter sp. W3-3-2]|uniref:Uncharacterized protein n=1 Tax=Paraconexibacter algicola TaxID=2133960 RepID=A0A2T4UJA0_9ACTN|nr:MULTISPECIES: hypothetical protein [Solirubrobacterales]MTD45654.1 hypothetical protein [Conexibacter sp. W3-3-2]PTL59323.1 hypothetical protein C7Y72_06485 [Paraconexibacter algicola]